MLERSTRRDTDNTLKVRYAGAATLMQGHFGARTLAFNTSVLPQWTAGQGACFWYCSENPAGRHYYRVDAAQCRRQAAFCHQSLALALAKASKQSVDPAQLPLQDLVLDPGQDSLSFTAFGQRWHYHEQDGQCLPMTGLSLPGKLSPDGRYLAFVRDHNLWLQDQISGEERALTTDGERFYAYGSEPTVFGYIAPALQDFLWSPDSQSLFTQRIDTRHLQTAPPLVQHLPPTGEATAAIGPSLYNPDRKLALPGEAHSECWQMLSIRVADGRVCEADYPACPMIYPVYQGFFNTGRGWWDGDSRHAYFIDQQLDQTQARVIKWDTQTGDAQILFAEAPELAYSAMPSSHTRTALMPLTDSDELIWYSERSGWAHLYLYDLKSGALKQTLTAGEWLVRGLLHFDPDTRELLIQTAGRVEGRNPYYTDICRVNIDSGELTEIIGSDHHYQVADQRHQSGGENLGVSPCGDYLVATRSRIDEAPQSLLLNRQGEVLMTLETADLSAMPEGWRWPEPVMLKGADGQTDIYGIIYRPSHFREDQSYPVIDLSWGLSPPVAAFNEGGFLDALAWAELGFIVVKFGNRGGGLRSKTFRDAIDPSLPYCNKADSVAGLRQLAARYPYMDLKRVGVASFLLYPEASSGLLVHPDMYQVGVDVSPMLDPRLMPRIGNFGGGCKLPPHEDFAENLRGKLLLIHGMMEDVVLPAHTFRLAAALQQANKSFDMLMLPTMDHSGPWDYAIKRSWDYLVEHLLGETPPVDFALELSVPQTPTDPASEESSQ